MLEKQTMNNTVVYDMIGQYVVPTITEWSGSKNIDELYKIFEGAVDVIGLRPAKNGRIGYDAWVRDDALATGMASAYRIQFGDEYFGMALLPQVGTGIVVLGVDESGRTFGLTAEQAQEVQNNLVVEKWQVAHHE